MKVLMVTSFCDASEFFSFESKKPLDESDIKDINTLINKSGIDFSILVYGDFEITEFMVVRHESSEFFSKYIAIDLKMSEAEMKKEWELHRERAKNSRLYSIPFTANVNLIEDYYCQESFEIFSAIRKQYNNERMERNEAIKKLQEYFI